jgi:hypothetical protein
MDKKRTRRCGGPAIGEPFILFKRFNGSSIPEPVHRYPGLSCGAKSVYARLARYAGKNGKCWPSMERLASEVGLGISQARQYVHELITKRFISIEERPGISRV